jgi:ABC-type polysaccharide transport system permease subunit
MVRKGGFKDFSLFKGIWGSPWIGFENFQYLSKSRDFFMIFKNRQVKKLQSFEILKNSQTKKTAGKTVFL